MKRFLWFLFLSLVVGLLLSGCSGKKSPLESSEEPLEPSLTPAEIVQAKMVTDWQNLYYETFGVTVDFSNLSIPAKRKGFERLIIVAQGMTVQRIFEKCQEFFPCEPGNSDTTWVDRIISDRNSQNSPYAIWLRDRVEADKELKDLSVNQLKEKGIAGITLEERLLFELKYFKETGKHLDIQGGTLCSGSSSNDNMVPCVFWYDGKLQVGWEPYFTVSDYLSPRQVVF